MENLIVGKLILILLMVPENSIPKSRRKMLPTFKEQWVRYSQKLKEKELSVGNLEFKKVSPQIFQSFGQEVWLLSSHIQSSLQVDSAGVLSGLPIFSLPPGGQCRSALWPFALSSEFLISPNS